MPRIFKWTSSLYRDGKWLYGDLQLYDNGLAFLEECNSNKTTPERPKTLFPFKCISEIKKASSKVIFSCIVIKFSGKDFWLSSFLNRDLVYNTIEHFWHDQLFSTSRIFPVSKNQELVQIAYDTQNSLLDAGRVLHKQGQQLTHASQMMNALHNDITVAKRLTDDIDSWFGAWRIKGKIKTSNVIPESFGSAFGAEKIEYPALFAKSQQEIHYEGYIIMRNKVFEFINKKSEIFQTFVISEITDFNIHSPWDMTIQKRIIGKPAIVLHIVSKRLPSILQTLEKVYKCDLNYDQPPCSTEYDASDEITMHSKSGLIGESQSNSISDDQLIAHSGQLGQKQQGLCEEDANEIGSVLKNIKRLALDIGSDLDAQNKQIDELDASVEHATARLKSVDWKVKKLTK